MAHKYNPNDRIDLTPQAYVDLKTRRQLKLEPNLLACYRQRQAESERYLERLIQELQSQLARLRPKTTSSSARF